MVAEKKKYVLDVWATARAKFISLTYRERDKETRKVLNGEDRLEDRLQARMRQLGLNPLQVAEEARVGRSYVYDILRGHSLHPTSEKLTRVAEVLRVDLPWLLHGEGEVEGELPSIEDPRYVPIRAVTVTASMGGGHEVVDEGLEGEPYHFLETWIRDDLKAIPRELRVMHVEGDSMEPTLLDGDVTLIDLTRISPTPPGIFVLFDGFGLVAKRLEHIPNSDPPTVRIVSDNPRYSAYERTAEEIRVIGRIRWFAREI